MPAPVCVIILNAFRPYFLTGNRVRFWNSSLAAEEKTSLDTMLLSAFEYISIHLSYLCQMKEWCPMVSCSPGRGEWCLPYFLYQKEIIHYSITNRGWTSCFCLIHIVPVYQVKLDGLGAIFWTVLWVFSETESLNLVTVCENNMKFFKELPDRSSQIMASVWWAGWLILG